MSESLLLTFARELNIESKLIPRIATGFCGGMARTGGYCGALTGGIMVLGLIAGRGSEYQSQAIWSEVVIGFEQLEPSCRYYYINFIDFLGVQFPLFAFLRKTVI